MIEGSDPLADIRALQERLLRRPVLQPPGDRHNPIVLRRNERPCLPQWLAGGYWCLDLVSGELFNPKTGKPEPGGAAYA